MSQDVIILIIIWALLFLTLTMFVINDYKNENEIEKPTTKKKLLDLSGAEIIAIHEEMHANDICCGLCKLNYDQNNDTEYGCLYHNAAAHMPANWLKEEIEI